MESGDAKGNEKEGQQALVDGDQQQSARVPSPFRRSFGNRSDGVPCKRLLQADTAFCLG